MFEAPDVGLVVLPVVEGVDEEQAETVSTSIDTARVKQSFKLLTIFKYTG